MTGEEYQSIHQFKEEYNSKNSAPPIYLHTHLAETKNEMVMIKEYLSQSNEKIDSKVKTSTQYLNSLGVLDEHLIAAHGVECNKSDMLFIKGINRKKNKYTQNFSNKYF